MQQLYDITVTPKPEQRVSCPICHVPAESMRYLRANIREMAVDRDAGAVQISLRVTACAEAEFEPCGHRFDGQTGDLIVHDD